MRIGVPKETAEGERRVALVPDVVRSLAARGLEVKVESDAGLQAGHPDAAYEDAGATVGSAAEAWECEIVVAVAVPDLERIRALNPGQVLVGHLAPLTSPETTRALA